MRWIGLWAVLGIICWTTAGWAERSPTHDLAKKHFELGNTYYEVSNYAQALAEFQKAYELEPLPGLIYNIARCHELLNNLKEAIAQYRLFLEKSPESKDRATVELRIKNLEKRLEQTRETSPTPPQAQAKPTEAVPTPAASPRGNPEPPVAGVVTEEAPRPSARPRSWKWQTGWIALGVGGASLIAGIISGAMVSSKNSEFEQGVQQNKTYSTLSDIRSSGQSFEKVEIATLVIGGVGLAAGGGLLLWEALGGSSETSSNQTALLPYAGPAGAGLSFSSRF